MVDKNCGRYLYRKRGVFYFSRHVPIDMRAHHGCSRIVVCLKTKSGDAAVKGSQALAQKLDDYWLSLRIQQAPIPSVQACVANPQKASIDVPVKPPFYVPLPNRVSGTGGRMFRA